jgi:hypothetical protein
MPCQWSQRAVKDLLFKVKDQAVCDYLVQVSKTSLHGCREPWGGSTAEGLLWRYGVAVADERLDERHLDDRQKLARTYRII